MSESQAEIICRSNNLRTTFQKHYTVDHYQRDYKWQSEQVEALIIDLHRAFINNSKSQQDKNGLRFSLPYFIGPIVIVREEDTNYLIDGQQRLTTLMLTIIFLEKKLTGEEDLSNLLKSMVKPFNRTSSRSDKLAVSEERRDEIVNKILEGDEDLEVDVDNISQTNLKNAYRTITCTLNNLSLSQEDLKKFINWLLISVISVEIIPPSRDMGVEIFETMNDRGIELTHAELLKCFVIDKFKKEDKKLVAEKIWQQSISHLVSHKKDNDLLFLRAWLRAKYAGKIGETPQAFVDYEQIGKRCHTWVRDNQRDIGISTESNLMEFIQKDLRIFSDQYCFLQEASKRTNIGQECFATLEAVAYNAYTGFKLQYACLLSPITLFDKPVETRRKFQLVANTLDIFIVRRILSRMTISASHLANEIFKLILQIRNLDVETLHKTLTKYLEEQTESLDGITTYRLDQHKKPHTRYILARITSWLEKQVHPDRERTVSDFLKLEIEHIIPMDYEMFGSNFDDTRDFSEYRNKLGALLLLPKSANASIGNKPYGSKRKVYAQYNFLAASLSSTDSTTPGLKKLQKAHKELNFTPHSDFGKNAIDARGELLLNIANIIWNPASALSASPKPVL